MAGCVNFSQQLGRDLLRRLLAGDLPDAASAERRHGLQYDRFETAPHRHGVHGGRPVTSQTPQPLAERRRVGVARGDYAVAHVDDLRLRPGLGKSRLKCPVQVGPAERDLAGEVLASRGAWVSSAGWGESNAQLHSTSQVATLNRSAGVSDANNAARNWAWFSRLPRPSSRRCRRGRATRAVRHRAAFRAGRRRPVPAA